MSLSKAKLSGLFVFCACLISSVHATDRIVPDQYSTIQSAINACSDWDRVLVKSGQYYEYITIDKSITLRAYELYEDSYNSITIYSPTTDPDIPVVTINASNVVLHQINVSCRNYQYNIQMGNLVENTIIDKGLIFGEYFGSSTAGIIAGSQNMGLWLLDCQVQRHYYGIVLGGSHNNALIDNYLSSYDVPILSWATQIEELHPDCILNGGYNWFVGNNISSNINGVGYYFYRPIETTPSINFQQWFYNNTFPGSGVYHILSNCPYNFTSWHYLEQNYFENCEEKAWLSIGNAYFVDNGNNSFSNCTSGQWD